MKTFYLTDAGKVRSHNEDSVTILKNQSDEYLLMVCDGMGGHRAGEVASSMVVTHMGKRFNEMASVGPKVDAINWMNDNINEVNRAIEEYAKKNPESLGMGTTVVMALLTKDHTLVNLLVQAGDLTEEEAKYHPKKNVLMKALGSGETAELDIFDVDMGASGILLCSDGLTNMLSVEQIEKVINDETLDIEEKVVKLIRKCNARGGTDNISVAYLEKESGE